MIKLWFDTETTGLLCQVHAVHQLGYLLEKDGVIIDTGEFNIKPFPGAQIDAEALAVSGVSKEQILANTTTEKEVYTHLKELLSKHVDVYKKDKTYKDKIILAGHNAAFDKNFLMKMWERASDKFFFALFESRLCCTQELMVALRAAGKIDVLNVKLSTGAELCGVTNEKAHSALADIKTTYSVYKILCERYLK